MQSARDLVAAAVAELAAGVQDGQHDLGGRALLLLVHVDGNAAAVVGDGDAVVGVQADLDGVAVTRQRLVDGVVDDLVDEVVQAALAGGADVHAGTLANGLETLEHRDVRGLVRGLALLALLLGRGLGRLRRRSHPRAWSCQTRFSALTFLLLGRRQPH